MRGRRVKQKQLLRITALVLAFVFLTSIVLVQVAQAQVSPPALTVMAAEAQPGATVQVPVVMSSDGQAAALEFNLTFDPALLTFESAVLGELTEGFTIATRQLPGDPGQVGILIANMDGDLIPAGSGKVAELSFKVAASAQPGQSCQLGLSDVKVVDEYAARITPVNLTNGMFKVPGSLAANLTAPVVEADPWSTLQVPIKLTSDGSAAGLQFDLGYDQTLLIYQNEVQVGDLTEGMTVTANKVADDRVRVIITPNSGNMKPGTGVAAKLVFKVAGTAQTGQTCKLELSNAELADANGDPIEPVALQDGSFTVGWVISPGSDPVLSVQDQTAGRGELVQIPVDLDSDGQVAALQFDFEFGKNLLSFQGVAAGDLTSGFSVTTNPVTANKVRVVIANFDNASIAAGTGSVVKIAFQVAADALAGQTCGLELSGIVLSDSSGDDISPFDLTNGTFTVAGQGDNDLATISGTVSTSDGQGDLTQANVQLKDGANVIATTNPSAAGLYSFSDVPTGNYTIEVSLSSYNTGTIGPFAVAAGAAVTGKNIQLVKTSGGDSLVLSVPTNLTGLPGYTLEVPVSLTSNGSLAGLQFDLGYDPALLAYQDEAAGDLTGGFSVTANPVAANKVRVIIVNFDNSSIAAGTGLVAKLNFQVADNAPVGQTCDLELSGVALSDSSGEPILGCVLHDGQFTVAGQVILATISGTVTTSDGQGDLTQASVQLKDGTNVVASATPLADGSYSFINVAAGTYTVEASLDGYDTGTIALFTVTAGAAVTGKDIQLEKVPGGDSLALSVATNLKGLPDSILEVPVNLTSDGSVVGLQFDLGYDPALLAYQDEAAGDLTGGFSVTANPVTANKVRVVIVNYDNASITAGTGSVVKLAFQVAADVLAGQTCGLELSEATLSDSAGEAISGCVLNNGLFTVADQLVLATISGTVSTSDGQGDLTQANAQLKDGANVIATTNPSAAGLYSFSDVPAGNYTIEVSLSGYNTGTIGPFAVAAGAAVTDKNIQLVKTSGGDPMALSVATDLTGLPGSTLEVPVSLTSDGSVAGLQFDLGYDPALLAYQDEAAGDLTGGFSVTANPVAANKVRVIIVNFDNSSIAAGTGLVAKLNFQVADNAPVGQTCDLELSGVALSDSSGEPILGCVLHDGQFTVAGQVILATISGTVTTSDGQGDLTQASVQLKDGTNVVATTNPSAAGLYSFSNVVAGTYNIEISLGGYDTGIIGPFTVAAGDDLTEDIELQRPSLPQSIYKLTYSGINPSGYEVQTLVEKTGQTQAQINAAVAAAVNGQTPIDVTLETDVLGQVGYDAVRIAPVGAGPNIQLWAKNTADNWYDINVSGWGPAQGFPLGAEYSVTTPVYVLVDQVGTYSLLVNLINVNNNDEIIASNSADIVTLASISGKITVNTGTPDFTEVSVQLRQGTSNVGAAVHPGDDGEYSIINVDAGTYTIRVSLDEYETNTIGSFKVEAGEAITGKNIQLVKTTGSSSGGGGGSGSGSGSSSGSNITKTCTFPDVPATHWAINEITTLCGRGIVNGYPDYYFRPENNITRAEFTKMIVGVMGLTPKTANMPTYKDVAVGTWYYGYVEAAAAAELVKGDEAGNFRPDAQITRQEIAVILVRAMGKEGQALALASQATSFADDQSIDDWARGYVSIASQEGLIKGYEDKTFRPDNNATRAEACTMLYRFLNK